MSNQKRKDVNLTKHLERYSLEGTLDNVIAYLTSLREETNGDAYLDISTYECYGDMEIEVELRWNRPETDDEYEKRCKAHHKRAAAAKKAAKTKKRETGKGRTGAPVEIKS